jgi:hypothetical protein
MDGAFFPLPSAPEQLNPALKAASGGAPRKKAKKAPAPTKAHPLQALLAAATTARAKVTQTAAPAVTHASNAPAPAASASYAAIEAQLQAQKQITDQLMMKELDREGLLVGIEDPMSLYSAAPEYFMKRVEKNVSLAGSASPATSGRSGLRAVSQAAGQSDDEGDLIHAKVSAYRNEQDKTGRRLSYAQALVEWEGKNPQAKKKALL